VLVLSGPPCAGKSSVGRALMGLLDADERWVYLEVDALFLFLTPRSDRNREDRMLAYDAAHALARLLLERGRTPVLECTYSRRQQRTSLLWEMADHASPLWVVEFEVSADDAVSRFHRRRQASDLTEQLVQERAQSFPRYDQALQLSSTATTVQDTARQIVDWLAQPPPAASRSRWAATGKD